MLTLAVTWTAVVLGIGVMLIMAVGPAVAELDGWLAERRRSRVPAIRRLVAVSGTPKPAIRGLVAVRGRG